MAEANNQPQVTAISSESFYGAPTPRDLQRSEAVKKQQINSKQKAHFRGLSNSIVGPSTTWRLFKKQDEALSFSRSRKNELMCFVYQQTSGERVFIVAHPCIYWYFDKQKEKQDRCSFEIIPEYSACKLYFDLEFETEFNSSKNGVDLTETFIKIVNFWLKQIWCLDINRNHILDLESTTTCKFSRHLIYQIPNTVFRNNYQVGNFVKMICEHLRKHIFRNLGCTVNECRRPHSKSSEEIHVHTSVIENVDEFLDSINSSLLNNLLIFDRKGKQKLFCDESVYTKNRHFRLFSSTKRNKNAPLNLSSENLNWSKSSNDEIIFLDSLITYFPSEKVSDLQFLEFGSDSPNPSKISPVPNLSNPSNVCRSSSSNVSPHPKVDKFIASLVIPGRVRSWLYFSSSNLLVYDIMGFRFCGNINRQHRSNGIKYVVNLNSCTYYQKCYDPDCAGYRSSELKLPYEIAFLYEGDECIDSTDCYYENKFQPTSSKFGLLDEEFVKILDVVETTISFNSFEQLDDEETCLENQFLEPHHSKSHNEPKTEIGNVSQIQKLEPFVTDEFQQHSIKTNLPSNIAAQRDQNPLSNNIVLEQPPCIFQESSEHCIDTCDSHFTNEELIQVMETIELFEDML